MLRSQQKIKDRFNGWIWQDDERRERLVKKYNEEFNNVRLRTFNGDHLTLPGATPVIVLDRHQKAAVWLILQTNNCLLAHVVGAGKTYTMAGVKKAKTNNLTNIPFNSTLAGVCGKLARAGVLSFSRPGQLSAVSVKFGGAVSPVENRSGVAERSGR